MTYVRFGVLTAGGINFTGFSDVATKYRLAKHLPIFQGIVNKLKKNSVVIVRKRTIPTERPQPVGEVNMEA
jgi:hypothetical protein